MSLFSELAALKTDYGENSQVSQMKFLGEGILPQVLRLVFFFSRLKHRYFRSVLESCSAQD